MIRKSQGETEFPPHLVGLTPGSAGLTIDLLPNTVHYYLSDHLGSTSIVASAQISSYLAANFRQRS